MRPPTATTSAMVYSAVAEELLALRPRACFGLMGEDTALLTAELSDGGVTYVAARHEAAAVGMAEGYAWATGELGICLVTRGPGFTNALTALRTAVRAHARLVLITGDAPTTRWYLPDPKAVDQRRAAAAVGLEYHEAGIAEEVLPRLRRALGAAQAGRPAALAVVSNVLNGPAAADAIAQVPPPPAPPPTPPAPRNAEIVTAAAIVAGSRRPLILAGRGAMHARDTLEELAVRTGALLGTTLPAKDLFLGSPYDLGVVGGFATDPAAALFPQVDCVLVFGASLTDFTTAERTLLRAANAVHVDVDSAKIGAFYPVEAEVVGDAAVVGRALLAALPESRQDKPFHDPATRARLDRPLYEGPDESDASGIDPRIVATTLDALLPEQRAVVVDTGRFSGAPSRYMRTSGVGSFRFTGDFGAIGSALGPALGAAVARPEVTTVLFVGDGGLLVSLPDLETAARHAIPLIIVVMNDRAFGAERHVLAAAGVDERHAEFDDTDFAAVARALGIEAHTIRSAADLHAAGAGLAGRTAPLLLDCKLRPDLAPPRVKEPGAPKTVARS